MYEDYVNRGDETVIRRARKLEDGDYELEDGSLLDGEFWEAVYKPVVQRERSSSDDEERDKDEGGSGAGDADSEERKQ